MRASYFLWGALGIGVSVSLFLLKYKVQALENELVARQEQVLKDRSAIRVLQAEWTYLNDPERLRRLSAEHLGFAPATAQNIADISALPFRSGTPEAAQTAPSAAVLPRPEVEAKAQPVSAEPSGFAPVLLSRIQNLLFSNSAGAATFPAKQGPAKKDARP
jgi:hypothetical protein